MPEEDSAPAIVLQRIDTKRNLHLLMLTKVYFNNKPLYLTDQITKDLDNLLHRPDTIFIDELTSHAVRTIIYEMDQPEIYRGIFLYSDTQKALDAFKSEMNLVQAAGGFICTPENKILLIFRRGKWDLPKGKLDEGEDLETCAIREIREETGLNKFHVERKLCITYHTYYERGKHILKETHWYFMNADGDQKLMPQHEEDIEKCEWADYGNISYYLENTHASIADVIKEGKALAGKLSNK